MEISEGTHGEFLRNFLNITLENLIVVPFRKSWKQTRLKKKIFNFMA